MAEQRDDKVIRRRVKRAVERSLAEAFNDPFWAQLEDLEQDARTPPLDVQDRGDHYLIVAEMPGIPREKMDIQVTEGLVEIRGENVLECDIDHMDMAYLCNERAKTNFHRKVTLPTPVLPDAAKAKLQLGVLTLVLPKRPEAEAGPRSVPIE